MDKQYALTNSAGTTPEIGWVGYEAGMVFIPASSSITSLTFHTAPKGSGTFLPLYTTAGVAVTQTVAHTRAYPLPAELRGCRAFKMVANAAGTVHVSFQKVNE